MVLFALQNQYTQKSMEVSFLFYEKKNYEFNFTEALF